jgi:RNA-splicing ligase RtcB
MIEIEGAYNRAKVFADCLDSESEKRIRILCDQRFSEGLRIRVMPDVHSGAEWVVGTAMTIKDKVPPNLVGVDIGCGMEVARINAADLDCEKLDKIIRANIPYGFETCGEYPYPLHPFAKQRLDIKNLRCARHVCLANAYRSVGTLGGGNHFIEADRDDDGGIYIVVHAGSRRLGLEVAEHYQNEGYKRLNKVSDYDRRQLIDKYKREGRNREINAALRETAAPKTIVYPKLLSYVLDDLFDDYIHDMEITRQFADINRRAIMHTILSHLEVEATERFTTIHNYIDTDAMILRRGAVSAKSGERLIIPMNMRDGSLICVGKGADDWNCSAPHGAGRLMNKADARRKISMSDFLQSMKGIYSSSLCQNTLDEAPMAYKPMSEIIAQIGDTVDIVTRIKPIYNFKALADLNSV